MLYPLSYRGGTAARSGHGARHASERLSDRTDPPVSSTGASRARSRRTGERDEHVGSNLARGDPASVRLVGTMCEVERLRSSPTELDVTVDEPPDTHVVGDVEVRDRIEQVDQFGPRWLVEQEVVALDDHDGIVRLHENLVGHRLVDGSVERRAVDDMGGRAQPAHEFDEGVGIEGLGCALDSPAARRRRARRSEDGTRPSARSVRRVRSASAAASVDLPLPGGPAIPNRYR